MRITTLLISSVFALGVMMGAAQAEEVRVGIASEPYPPFASPTSDGKWEGWEIEMIGAVCKAAELDCKIVPVAWDGIIPSLTGSQIDAIMASMSITAERAKTIDFSNAYYNTPAVIVAGSSMKGEATAKSLAGKIVGVQASTTHQTYAQKHFKESEIRVYQTQDEANQDLNAGRVDAIQADSIAMADFVASDLGKCCKILGAVENDEEVLGRGVGAGVRKGDKKLLDALNRGIAAVIADGTHDKITAKYFKTSILAK